MKLNFLKYLFLSAAVLLFCPSSVMAIQLNFDNDTIQVPVDQFFSLSVKVSLEKQCLNIIKTAISFPSDQLEFKEFDYSDSIVGLWIETPKLSEGRIYFTAGLPRGYCQDPFNREQNTIVKLIFKAKNNHGSARVAYDETQTKIFLNDGQGTASTFSLKGVLVTMVGKKAGVVSSSVLLSPNDLPSITDREPPVDLTANTYRENGRYYAAFYASDRQSGIDHYEISFAGRDFIQVFSPYEIKGDDLYLPFEIKAIDRAGNEAKVAVAAALVKGEAILYLYLSVVIIFIISLFWFGFSKFRKNKSKNI